MAGAIAAVAMVQATGQQQSPMETLTVAQSATPLPELSYTPIELPEVPAVEVATADSVQIETPVAAAPSTKNSKPKADKSSSKATAKATASVSASPSPTSKPTAEVTATVLITPRQAESTVLNQTQGTIVSTTSVTHAGLDAFAVQISRPDGSVVTGYVDASSGTVFEWVVNKQATPAKPAAPAQPANGAGSTPNSNQYNDDHDDDHGDDHGDDHDDDHEDDHGDDHDGDDD